MWSPVTDGRVSERSACVGLLRVSNLYVGLLVLSRVDPGFDRCRLLCDFWAFGLTLDKLGLWQGEQGLLSVGLPLHRLVHVRVSI